MSSNIIVKLLGTGTIAPDPNRSCTSTFIETPKEKILVDIGCGTLRRLSEEKIDIHSINHIFITHFHPDHVGDLVPFLFAKRNVRSDFQMRKVHVWGPRGLMNFLKGMEIAYGRWIKDSTSVKYDELGRRLMDLPGFRVIWNKVIHKIESVGYRFEIGGNVISFSGDSGYCQELVGICKQADIAVLECSHADEHAVEGHLSPSLSARIANGAAVKKLVLTHFYPDAIKSDIEKVARKFFGGEIVLAKDGMELTLPMDENSTKKED